MIAPVNGSRRCCPATGPDTSRVSVHRPPCGEPWKNCRLCPKPSRLSSASKTALDCSETGWPLGSDQVTGQLVVVVGQPERRVQRRPAARHLELVGERLAGVAGRRAAGQRAGERAACRAERDERPDDDRDAAVVGPPVPRCSRRPSSPAWPAVTVTLNVAGLPGRERPRRGRHRAGAVELLRSYVELDRPGVGRAALLTVKITAVHVPAFGWRTSTWPKPLWSVPSSEYAATWPCGSNSVSNTAVPLRRRRSR